MGFLQRNLSRREKEVLTLISFGYSTDEIGHELHLSKETIKTHRKRIIAKMCAKNAADLVRKAFESRVLSVAASH